MDEFFLHESKITLEWYNKVFMSWSIACYDDKDTGISLVLHWSVLKTSNHVPTFKTCPATGFSQGNLAAVNR